MGLFGRRAKEPPPFVVRRSSQRTADSQASPKAQAVRKVALAQLVDGESVRAEGPAIYKEAGRFAPCWIVVTPERFVLVLTTDPNRALECFFARVDRVGLGHDQRSTLVIERNPEVFPLRDETNPDCELNWEIVFDENKAIYRAIVLGWSACSPARSQFRTGAELIAERLGTPVAKWTDCPNCRQAFTEVRPDAALCAACCLCFVSPLRKPVIEHAPTGDAVLTAVDDDPTQESPHNHAVMWSLPSHSRERTTVERNWMYDDYIHWCIFDGFAPFEYMNLHAQRTRQE
jgi:hypothetical protein